VKLISPSELREAARQRAASRPAPPPKQPKHAIQREIIRAIAAENEYRIYILLECHHYTTRDTQERNEDGKHPGLYFCEPCFEATNHEEDIYERMENCWKERAPAEIYANPPDKRGWANPDPWWECKPPF